MNEKHLYNLIIDREFAKLTPAATPEEYAKLERKILYEAYQKPIVVWNKIVIEGLTLYGLYHKLSIPFHIEEIDFVSRNEAISHICLLSLKNAELVEEQMHYCVGKLYNAQKRLFHEKYPVQNQYTPAELRRPNFTSTKNLTATLIEKYYPMSEGSICKYKTYSEALDELDKKAPEIVDDILLGNFHIRHTNTVELSKLSAEEIRVIHTRFKNGKGQRLLPTEMQKSVQRDKERIKKENRNLPKPVIKQMPKYDPDAELSSLTLTIPMWISSMKRTMSLAKFGDATTEALYKLDNQLAALEDQINTLQKIIREEYHE